MVLLTSAGALYSCDAATVAPPDDDKDAALLPTNSRPAVLWDVRGAQRVRKKVTLSLPPETISPPAEDSRQVESPGLSIFTQCASEGDFKAYYDFVKGMKKNKLTKFFGYWPDSTVFLGDLDVGGVVLGNTLGAFKQALFDVIDAVDLTPTVGAASPSSFTDFKRAVELRVLLDVESHIRFFELAAPSYASFSSFDDDLQLCDFEEFRLLNKSITSDPESPLKDPTVQGVFDTIRSVIESE